jgi:hypothetical protein
MVPVPHQKGFKSHPQEYYYEYQNNRYVQVGQDIEYKNAEDQFGYSVSISDNGNIFAISAPNKFNDLVSRFSAGSVKVFSRAGTSFSQIGNEISELPNDKYKASKFGKKIVLNGESNEISISSDAAVYTPYLKDGLIQTYKFVNGKWSPKSMPIIASSKGVSVEFMRT